MKDTRELVDLLLADTQLNAAIHSQEHLQAATLDIVLRIQARELDIQIAAGDINAYIQREPVEPIFPRWMKGEITATTALLVGALNDWERPIEQRDPAARMLHRVLFGREHAPPEWWATMTGADMVYAIGYTHAQVPLEVAPNVLARTRGGVHWLRTKRGLELTDRSFFDYVQGSAEWKAQARQPHLQPS